MDAVSYSNSNASAGESGSGGSGRNDLTILDCFDRPIAFHRCFVTLTGSVTAALMLSQAYYWQKRAKSQDGWWFKTRDDWIEETGMGRREQEGARKKLRALGILREDLRGVPATLWYKVEETKLLEAIANLSNPASSSPTLPTPVGTKPPFQLVRNRPTGRAETAPHGGRMGERPPAADRGRAAAPHRTAGAGLHRLKGQGQQPLGFKRPKKRPVGALPLDLILFPASAGKRLKTLPVRF